MENLPDEILLQTFSYLNILDIGECVMVSKQFQKICQDKSLSYNENNTMPSLYKKTTSYYMKELIYLGEYEKAMGLYKQGCTNQWHLDDDVTLECRRHSISMLVQAMKPSSEQDDDLFAYAKSVEKTMYNIASGIKSYLHLMAESIYNRYHISKASNPKTDETTSFGIVIDQKVLRHFMDSDKYSIKTIPNEYIKSWHDGNVSSKLRNHMVHLNCIPPSIFTVSQAFMLNPHLNNIHTLSARNKERSFYKKANSRAEYFRLMALNIYMDQMKHEDARAKHRAGQARNAAPARIAQCDPFLKEPSYNQINVEFGRKFVRPYNFKRGHRRKFFLFAEDQDLARNPKSVCPLCNPI